MWKYKIQIFRLSFVILSLLCHLEGQTQEITFRHLTSEDGISQSEVYCFLQDREGFMWFGTLDGLNKYDGYTIKTFKMDREDPNSLIHNTIYSLVEDNEGRLWIGTDNGLNIYVPEEQKMYTVPNFYSGKKLIIRTLLADGRNLWIGTQEGLFRLTIPVKDIGTRQLSHMSKTANHVDLEIRGKKAIYVSIYEIIKSKNGNIWLGTWEGPICFDFKQNRKVEYIFTKLPDKIEKITEVASLIEDRNGSLWIGTDQNGLFRYIPGSARIDNFRKTSNSQLLSDNIKTITCDSSGNIWVGTSKDGLIRISSDQTLSEKIQPGIFKSNEFQPESLNSNLIRSIYSSKDGLLWIGTIGNGINVFNPFQKNFKIIRIPPLTAFSDANNFVRSVYKDKNHNIWLGLHNGGLVKYNAESKEFIHMGLDSLITLFHISPLDKDHLWVASSSGAYIMRTFDRRVSIEATVRVNKVTEMLASNAAFYIEKSANNIYWIATMSGIVRVSLKPGYKLDMKLLDVNSNPSIYINNTRVLLYDSLRNTLWAGTEGGGLNEILLDESGLPKKINVHKSEAGNTPSVSSDYIRSLYLDGKNRLYIGTYEGLNRFEWNADSGKYDVKVWKLDDGLPNNMVQSIEMDENGLVWLGTNGGLSMYNPDSDRFTNYKISDGLQSNEFSEHASFKTDSGELLFGGINGVNTFYPDQIFSNPQVPVVKLEDFYLFNKKVKVSEKINGHVILQKPVDFLDTIILRSRENDIRFEFSALFYGNPEKIRYAYILEGYDKDWIYTDALQRNAYYTNLSFGKYRFMVKASNSDGIWSENPTYIFIQIKTPFYLKWYAFIIYLLIFILVLFYFTRYSIIKITTKRNLVLENEHNQKLHELDMLRTRFFINVSHDLRTPLTLITGPIENIVKNFRLNPELRQQIDLISRSAKRLKYLIEQMLDMRKVEADKLYPCPVSVDLESFIRSEAAYFDLAMKNLGIRFKIVSSEPSFEACVDQDMMGKIIFNLLSNAIKYTRNGEISVHLSRIPANTNDVSVPMDLQNKNLVKIEVKDTGKGMSEDKLNRIFERFYQDSDAPGSGYGIGLSHTKDLVDAHSGIIEVKSKPGVGTSFTIYMPSVSIIESDSKQEDSKSPGIKNSDPKIIHGSPETADNVETSEKKCVLIVEDNVDLQSYLISSLKSEYKILKASDGEEGFTIALKDSPDLIVSDIIMPNKDGYELCRLIKTTEGTSHIPVILLTARVDDESKYKGLDTGADDYITKPFNTEYLLLRIKNILNTREHLRYLFQRNFDLEPSAVTVTSHDENFLRKLLEKVEEGIPESEFTVESLEKDLGVSHTHFYRKVKSLTGLSGKELLQGMRLKRSAQLLSQNKLRVSEIAYMTGFTNPKYFSKCFKEQYGVTPSEYIENHNKPDSE